MPYYSYPREDMIYDTIEDLSDCIDMCVEEIDHAQEILEQGYHRKEYLIEKIQLFNKAHNYAAESLLYVCKREEALGLA